MSRTPTNQFVPDYLVKPGEILEEYLHVCGMTQAELASRTGLAKKTINEIIKAKSPITPETALKLERSLGRSANFWSSLERQYQEDKVRLADKKRMANNLEWLKEFPIKEMAKLRWIRIFKDKFEQLDEILHFFGVASPAQWKKMWCDNEVAYRQTLCSDIKENSVFAWLRQGEICSKEIECQPFDSKKFIGILHEIRALTNETPEIFVKQLVSKCASTGVAVVFVPELPGMRTWGATRWLGDHAVIQLSLRYKSNDHLWFTFCHEAGHILKHGRKQLFVEQKELKGEKEKEADDFAENFLISPTELQNFLGQGEPTIGTVKNFACKIGIAPGIVVGRLQYDGVWKQNIGNGLKVYYEWKSPDKK